MGRSVDELLRKVEALKLLDSEGEVVIPANWVPGAETIPNTIHGTRDYFANNTSN